MRPARPSLDSVSVKRTLDFATELAHTVTVRRLFFHNKAGGHMDDAAKTSRPGFGPYEFFMLCLCVWALLSLATSTFLKISDSTATILTYADYGVCGLFLLDFLRSLFRAHNKLAYLATWGWIDLLSSIPSVGTLRWGRAARVLRILRVMRGLRSARAIAQFLAGKRGESAFLASILLTFLVVVCASIAVLQFEPVAGGNIRTPQDAMWWAVSTITTVGYGDTYPITPEGRLVAVGLMFAGVSLFGTLAGLLASQFLSPVPKQQDVDLAEIRGLLRALRSSTTTPINQSAL